MDTEERVQNLLAQMTLAEKITLLTSGMKTAEIPRVGIHALRMADGPQGIRIGDQNDTVALPSGIALAASFDTALAEKYGRAIALDGKALGIRGSFGPALNLMRTPLGGRNFEYYGEDPVLAGKTAAGYVRGCQREKVAATPKHMALNNQEICRTTSSSDAAERTLRELYLKAFEIIVKESRPWMLMSSYNRINGTYASEYGFIQELIVKREWRFDGVMISDYGGAHDTAGCMLGGLDLDLGGPGMPFAVKKVLPLVKAGVIPESLLDEKVSRILRLLCRTEAIDGTVVSGECAGAEQRQTARECAEESIVLLKNSHALLPLDPKKHRRILISGPNADFRHHHGTLRYQGGSGAVFSEREVPPLSGLMKFASENGIDMEYIPTIRFLHDRRNPAGFFGEGGIACRFYPDAAAMREDRDPICDTVDNKGFLEFHAIGSSLQEGVVLPTDFTARITTELVPGNDPDSGVIISVSSGKCSITLDGKVFPEINTELDFVRIPLVPGKTAQLEIIYSPDNFRLSALHIIYDAPSALSAAKTDFLKAAKDADAVIFAAGRNHLFDKESLGEGNMQQADIPDMKMPEDQDAFIRQIASVNPNTIVTLTGGSAMDIEAWQNEVSAILMLWYPGEAGGTALTDILWGKVNPSGKLPFSWAKNLMDYPCHANGSYPGNRTDADPHVHYEEGIFIGYRHFDRSPISLRYPFGFGLSYAVFEQQLVEVKQTGSNNFDAACTVKVKVKNVSSRSGKEVVQIYTGAVNPEFPRPVKELKAFAKVSLAPGEEKILTFDLKWDDFACFHPDKHHWCVPAGRYCIFLASDASHVIAGEEITFEDIDNKPDSAASLVGD